MSRSQKRRVSKAKRSKLIGKLDLAAVTPGDWAVICTSLIHEREDMLAESEAHVFEGSTIKDAERVATFRDKAERVNAVLIRLRHPAAIPGRP